MQFEGRSHARRPKNTRTILVDDETSVEFDAAYQRMPGLQLYYEPPGESISLRELEEFALERLKVLKLVELTGITKTKSSDEYKKALDKGLTDLGWDFMTKPIKRMENKNVGCLQKRKDHISHFILRLAYCRTDTLRNWFVQQEVDLFRYRFSLETNPDDIKIILAAHRLKYDPISSEEKQSLKASLGVASHGMSVPKVDTMDFYKVSWLDVLDLVRTRKVYLSGGWAYVPKSELISLVLTVYRTHLKKVLAQACRALPAVENDERIHKALAALSSGYVGEDYSNKKNASGEITAESIDMLSQQSFPLCMQQLQQHLKTVHHMKHDGRQQYGLFLKAIGLPLEEALKFWKSHFSKGIVDNDKFDKTYAYAVRHNYGKEGKRTSYSAYSCTKIIMAADPKGEECHGCPFRHSDAGLLRQKLELMKLKKDDIDRVLELKKQSHYNVACMRVFELQHGVTDCQFSLQHPNQYFEESQKLLHGDSGSSRSGASAPKTSTQGASTLSAAQVSASAALKPGLTADSLSQEELNEFDEMMGEEYS